MKYTNNTNLQHIIRAQLNFPMACKHKLYGVGKVVDVKISDSAGDLILVCQFNNSRLGLLYSKLDNATLQLPQSQRRLLDKLLDTIDEDYPVIVSKSKNTAGSSFKASSSSEEIAVKALSADDSDNKEEAVDSVKSSRKAKSRKTQDQDILSVKSFEAQDTLQTVVSIMDTTGNIEETLIEEANEVLTEQNISDDFRDKLIEEPTSEVIVSEEPISEAD